MHLCSSVITETELKISFKDSQSQPCLMISLIVPFMFTVHSLLIPMSIHSVFLHSGSVMINNGEHTGLNLEMPAKSIHHTHLIVGCRLSVVVFIWTDCPVPKVMLAMTIKENAKECAKYCLVLYG